MKKLAIGLIVAILGVFTYATTLFNSYFWTSRIPSTLENASELAMWIAAAFTALYALFVYLGTEYKKWHEQLRIARMIIVGLGILGAVTFFDQSAALNDYKAAELERTNNRIDNLSAASASAVSQGVVTVTDERITPEVRRLEGKAERLAQEGAIAGNSSIDKLASALPFLPYSLVAAGLGAFCSWVIDYFVFLLVVIGLSLKTELYPPKVNTRSAPSSKQDKVEQILELWDELNKKPTIKQVMDLLGIQKSFASRLINEAKNQRGKTGNAIPFPADSGEFPQRKSA